MTFQLDAMALYKSKRGEQVEYKLDSLNVNDPEELTSKKGYHDAGSHDYLIGVIKQNSAIAETMQQPVKYRVDYSVYNMHAMRLEDVIAAQRALDEVIRKRRKIDPNYSVTVLRRDGSIP